MSRSRRRNTGRPGVKPLVAGMTAVAAAFGVLVFTLNRPSGPSEPTASERYESVNPTAVATDGHSHRRTAQKPIAKLPANEPGRGLVYDGLEIARSGPCVGEYKLREQPNCTHGPDPAPLGKSVAKPVEPVTKPIPKVEGPSGSGEDPGGGSSQSNGGSSQSNGGSGGSGDSAEGGVLPGVDLDVNLPLLDRLTTGEQELLTTQRSGQALGTTGRIVCDGDGRTGARVQVLYVHGRTDRFDRYAGSFAAWAADADGVYHASAQETGGVRHIRYVTDQTDHDCALSVLNVQLADSALRSFNDTITALKRLGYDRRDRKYLAFVDANVYCGIATRLPYDEPDASNPNNVGPSYARIDSGCWSGDVVAHELAHSLGAVAESAPHSTGAGHCVDEYDLLCYADGGSEAGLVRVVCTDRQHDVRLDCGHDDYFHTNPEPGTYLATHWNVADSSFLIKSDAGQPRPRPSPPAGGGEMPRSGLPYLLVNPFLPDQAAGVYAASRTDGAPAVWTHSSGYADQQWIVAGGGFVTLRSKASGACLQPYQASTEAGRVVVQARCDGGPAQQWRVVKVQDGPGVRLLNRASGLALAPSSVRLNGQYVLAQYPADAASQPQVWSFVAVSRG